MAFRKKPTQKPKESKYKNEKLVLESIEKSKIDNLNIIGVDETGVGDYFSPLIAAAVFVPESKKDLLISLGVKDSKKMDDKRIREIAPTIKENFIHSINHLTQEGYNRLNKRLNANELKMFLHLKSINSVELNEESKKVDYVLIDKYSTEDSIKKYYESFMNNAFLKTFPIKNKTAALEKAEDISLAVAAASIIARDKLIEMMEEQDEDLNFKFPLGAGDKVDQTAIKFIDEFGFENLFKVAKIQFANTEKAKIDSMLKTKDKDEYNKIKNSLTISENITSGDWLPEDHVNLFLEKDLSSNYYIKTKKLSKQKTIPSISVLVSLFSKEKDQALISKTIKVNGFKTN